MTYGMEPRSITSRISFRTGLQPGGLYSTRNSVYLAPLTPWDDEFRNLSRSGSDTFVQIDPAKLLKLVPKGKVMQTANGTILVNVVIPPAAFVCVDTVKKGPHQIMWHRSVAGMFPTSVGPAVKGMQRGGWSMQDGRWTRNPARPSGESILARAFGGGSTSTTGQSAAKASENLLSLETHWQIMKCPNCEGDFVSGIV